METVTTSVTFWGTGTPQREFPHVDDLGEACVFARKHWDPAGCHATNDANCEPLTHMNIGKRVDLSISTLSQAVSFSDNVVWATSKPDGNPKKQLEQERRGLNE